jgi:hypothetical protein
VSPPCPRLLRSLSLLSSQLLSPALLSSSLLSDEGDTVDSSEDSVILEVRPGTGGDEASLFAFELFNSYKKQSSNESWQWDELSRVMNEYGGLKEVSGKVTHTGSRSSAPHAVFTPQPLSIPPGHCGSVRLLLRFW